MFGEFVGPHATGTAGYGTVVVDEHVRGLSRNAKRRPELALQICNMVEAIEPELIDERRHLLTVVLTGHTNEPDVFFELLFSLYDRRGNGFAVRSPRCPEPQHRVLAREILVIELASSNRIGLEAYRIAIGLTWSTSGDRAQT